MREPAIEPVCPAPNRRLADDRRRRDLAGAPLEVDEVAFHMLMHAAEGRRENVVQRRLQLLDAVTADGDSLDYRNPELVGQAPRVELEPVTLGQIDHVQRNDRRK